MQAILKKTRITNEKFGCAEKGHKILFLDNNLDQSFVTSGIKFSPEESKLNLLILSMQADPGYTANK